MKLIKFMMVMLFVVGLCFAKGTEFKGTIEGDSFTFKDDNHYAINQEISETLLQEFTEKVMSFEGNVMYLFIESPGGGIFAGTSMIRTMDSREDIKFICIARFAFSAAFMIFENCDERYLVSDGVIMSHNGSATISDELPRMKTILKTISDVVEDQEAKEAKRLKMSLKEYQARINNNFWMASQDALKYNATDAVLNKVSCSKELVKKRIKRTVTISTIFMSVTKTMEFSACPLLSMPVIGQEDRESYIQHYNNSWEKSQYGKLIRSIEH